MTDPAAEAAAAARRAQRRHADIPNVVMAGQPIGECPSCGHRFDYSRGTDVHNLDRCPRCGSHDWYKWGYRHGGEEIRRDEAWDRYSAPPSVTSNEDCNGRDSDTESNPDRRTDGGSKYVNPTGDGYVGTFAVSAGSCSVNMVSAGVERGTPLAAVATAPDTVRLMARDQVRDDAEVLQLPVVSDRGYIEIGAAVLGHLDPEKHGDLRLYDRPGDGGFVLVAARADPFVVRADGGHSEGGSKQVLVEFAGDYFQAVHAPDTDCEPEGDQGFDGRMVGPVPVSSVPDEDACSCWERSLSTDSEQPRTDGGQTKSDQVECPENGCGIPFVSAEEVVAHLRWDHNRSESEAERLVRQSLQTGSGDDPRTDGGQSTSGSERRRIHTRSHTTTDQWEYSRNQNPRARTTILETGRKLTNIRLGESGTSGIATVNQQAGREKKNEYPTTTELWRRCLSCASAFGDVSVWGATRRMVGGLTTVLSRLRSWIQKATTLRRSLTNTRCKPSFYTTGCWTPADTVSDREPRTDGGVPSGVGGERVARDEISLEITDEGPALHIGETEILLRTFLKLEAESESWNERTVELSPEIDCDGDNGCWFILTPDETDELYPWIDIQPEVGHLDTDSEPQTDGGHSENGGELFEATDPDTGERLYHYEWNGWWWCDREREAFDWETGTVECPHCGDTFRASGSGTDRSLDTGSDPEPRTDGGVRWHRRDADATLTHAGVADQDSTCRNGTEGCPGPDAGVGELPCPDCFLEGGDE